MGLCFQHELTRYVGSMPPSGDQKLNAFPSGKKDILQGTGSRREGYSSTGQYCRVQETKKISTNSLRSAPATRAGPEYATVSSVRSDSFPRQCSLYRVT